MNVVDAQGEIAGKDLFPGGALGKTVEDHRDGNSGPRCADFAATDLWMAVHSMAIADSARLPSWRGGQIRQAPDQERQTPLVVSHILQRARNGLEWERGDPVPRYFDVVLERDEEGYYVASVPQIPACHTQARSLDEVTQRIREAIELCLEVEGAPEQTLEFIGIQRVTIAA